MQVPLQVTFRGFATSEAVTRRIAQKVDKLEQRFGRIIGCRVVIEVPHHHHQRGRTFQVSVDLQIPGAEILATSDGGREHAPDDVYVALRDAFDAVQRNLLEHLRRRHGDERRQNLGGLRATG